MYLNDIGASSTTNEPKSPARELDELFGSIQITSDHKSNVASSYQRVNVDQLDDCLPLFPINTTHTTKTNNQSKLRIFLISINKNLYA